MSNEKVDLKSLSRNDRRARLIKIRERGYISQRLDVELPPDLHGEWVLNDPAEIARMQSLGFDIDTVHAASKALHSDGSGKAIVGDVIFMTCPKEIKEDIDWAEAERMRQFHNPRKPQAEEANVVNSLQSLGLEPTNISTRTRVDNNEIKGAVSSDN